MTEPAWSPDESLQGDPETEETEAEEPGPEDPGDVRVVTGFYDPAYTVVIGIITFLALLIAVVLSTRYVLGIDISGQGEMPADSWVDGSFAQRARLAGAMATLTVAVVLFIVAAALSALEVRAGLRREVPPEDHGLDRNVSPGDIAEALPKIITAASFARGTALLVVAATLLALASVFLLSTIEDGPAGGQSDGAESTSTPSRDPATTTDP